MIQHIFTNNEALIDFLHLKYPSIQQAKRMILLELRKKNFNAPDHLLRLQIEEHENVLKNFSVLFGTGFSEFSKKYLEIRGETVYTVKDSFFEWQDILTLVPPSFLIASRLSTLCFDDVSEFYRSYITPNTKHTMLLSPYIIQLDNKVEEWNGLNDLHIHLNGSLETDKVWQDFLSFPVKLKSYFEKVDKQKALEQLSQEGFRLTPSALFEYLCLAKSIRIYFYEYLKSSGRISGNVSDEFKSTYEGKSKQLILKGIVENSETGWEDSSHPFNSICSSSSNEYASLECLMFVLIIKEIREYNNEFLAELFYFYLLIYSLMNRLLVHQLHQKGFEQFQKITLNEMREFSEVTFDRRFFQLAGNSLKNLSFLEGRISPQKSLERWVIQLNKINDGWSKFSQYSKTSKLGLVVHFIKKVDSKNETEIRHYALRKDILDKAHVLRTLLNSNSIYKKQILGIDAASSEFDTAPEVFGPIFKMLRRNGIKHFTYHAGEDFYHIISGMRAIYEAITFCELSNGDRIGHSVAIGLDAVQWGEIVGDTILMKQGDYLDDLVFLYYLISNYNINGFSDRLNLIKGRAEHLYYLIYEKYIPIEALISAWKIRGVCPIHLGFNGDAKYIIIKDERELDLCKKLKSSNEQGVELYENYHSNKFREKYNLKVKVDIDEFISLEEVEIIQKALLEMMNKKEIIIETLPMSNVRIGFHQDFSTYHLWNWIKWKKEGIGVPPIIIGSDDTGIFATNIYNEYANVYLMLVQYHNVSHSEAIKILEEFKQNGDTYRFK